MSDKDKAMEELGLLLENIRELAEYLFPLVIKWCLGALGGAVAAWNIKDLVLAWFSPRLYLISYVASVLRGD